MKKIIAVLIGTFASFLIGFSQNNVGIGTASPDSSAVLDVFSNNKGLLIPRHSSAQRNAIVNPHVGLQVFDTDLQCIVVKTMSGWRSLCDSVTTTGGMIQTAKITLSVAQVLTLGTDSVIGLPAPGPGKINVPLALGVLGKIHFGTTPYAFTGSLAIRYASAPKSSSILRASTLLTDSVDNNTVAFVVTQVQSTGVVMKENDALVIYALNGNPINPTGGDSTFDIFISFITQILF